MPTIWPHYATSLPGPDFTFFTSPLTPIEHELLSPFLLLAAKIIIVVVAALRFFWGNCFPGGQRHKKSFGAWSGAGEGRAREWNGVKFSAHTRLYTRVFRPPRAGCWITGFQARWLSAFKPNLEKLIHVHFASIFSVLKMVLKGYS